MLTPIEEQRVLRQTLLKGLLAELVHDSQESGLASVCITMGTWDIPKCKKAILAEFDKLETKIESIRQLILAYKESSTEHSKGSAHEFGVTILESMLENIDGIIASSTQHSNPSTKATRTSF